MQITPGKKGPKVFANGREGLEFTLVPETSVDQLFISELANVLRQKPHQGVDEIPMNECGSYSKVGDIEGRVYSEFTVVVYETAK